jgi:methanogenic corrinoid protein MtbC1
VTEQSARPDRSTSQQEEQTAARLSRLYLDALRANDVAGAYRVAARGVDGGLEGPALYERVISPAMRAIGELWEKGAITVADEHLATALTQRVLAALRPPVLCDLEACAEANAPERRRAMLAAAQGEQHALGLRMAADVLEDAGYRTIYLGADVPTEALLQAVASLSPDLLVMSATMPEFAASLERAVAAVRNSHPRLELLVGGPAARLATGVEEAEVENFEMLRQRATAALQPG